MKKLQRIFLAVCVATLLASTAAAQPAQSPMERVREGADALISMLQDPAVQNPASHDDAIAKLRAKAEEYIDFRTVTMYSVGRPWLDMTPTMQDDLVEAFVQLLERTYLKRIPAYEGQRVDYKSEMIQGQKARVVAEVVDKDKKIVVEFRLKVIQGSWMIYDMVAEGVSLVSNYRSQFNQILQDGSPEKLLRLIRERIEKLDREQAEEAAAVGAEG